MATELYLRSRTNLQTLTISRVLDDFSIPLDAAVLAVPSRLSSTLMMGTLLILERDSKFSDAATDLIRIHDSEN